MRAYIEIAEDLHYQLKILAATEGKSMRRLVAEALLETYPQLNLETTGANNGERQQ